MSDEWKLGSRKLMLAIDVERDVYAGDKIRVTGGDGKQHYVDVNETGYARWVGEYEDEDEVVSYFPWITPAWKMSLGRITEIVNEVMNSAGTKSTDDVILDMETILFCAKEAIGQFREAKGVSR